jgi:SAM-dependent methyltransferase
MIDALTFWNDEFLETFQSIAYTDEDKFYSTRRDLVLGALSSLPKGHILDVGCGGGHVSEALAKSGWTGEACDFSPKMVDAAKQRLRWPVSKCNATKLSPYSDASFDAVLCLGPAEYVGDAAAVYREAWRVLKPGGMFICAHINALFDLVTCDKFTVEFLINMFPVGERMRPYLEARLSGDEPTSLRLNVKTRTDNPLTISTDLSSEGLSLKDTLFYRFYSTPPFVERALSSFDQPNMDSHDWRGHFMASSFLSVSTSYGSGRANQLEAGAGGV